MYGVDEAVFIAMLVKGREVFLKAGEAFEPEYERACEEAIDEMINAI